MSNIYSKIHTALVSLGFECKEQGTFGDETTWPETFTTYQIIDSPNNSHADNVATSRTILIQTAIYSKDPAIKQDAERLLKSVMLPAGFIRVGGRDLPFNRATGHYAYTTDFRLFESEE